MAGSYLSMGKGWAIDPGATAALPGGIPKAAANGLGGSPLPFATQRLTLTEG